MRVGQKFAAVCFLITAVTFAQPSPWRLAQGTEGVYVAAMDLYRNGERDTMYALGAKQTSPYGGHGIFLRSLDGGATWDSISQLGTDVGAIKVDPSSSQMI